MLSIKAKIHEMGNLPSEMVAKRLGCSRRYVQLVRAVARDPSKLDQIESYRQSYDERHARRGRAKSHHRGGARP
jgi:hypothetical protein